MSSKEDKKTISLWVSDNGKTLEASSLDEITKPFYKKDKARTAKANSNFGLGLAIVKTIVEQHHGNVELINMPALYTKAFKVSFPKKTIPRVPKSTYKCGPSVKESLVVNRHLACFSIENNVFKD
ncbi:sensor histidine kinase [Streptococcus uberis]|nr:sensor histidine kinase [Streptococcus uberis]